MDDHSLTVLDDVPTVERIEPRWTFRFRGRKPGRQGGAVVVVGEFGGDLVAGVSICAADDVWDQKRGIEKAAARMNSVSRNGRTNRWRFSRAVSDAPRNLSAQAHDLACVALHHAFALHSPTEETLRWFTWQLPWVVNGLGARGKVRVG